MNKLITWLVAGFFILLSISSYLIFIYAPEEATQGLVQKIFYFHVSSAFAMYFGFGLGGLFAIVYLIRRHPKWDHLSQAGCEVGLVFCTMVLASGPLWARPIWGTWWTWDPRLTTTFLSWLLFLAVLLIRRFFQDHPRGPVFASIFTIFGLVNLPLIFLSVKLWRGIHPAVLGQKGNMPAEMKVALIASNITITLFFGILYWIRYRLKKLEAQVTELQII